MSKFTGKVATVTVTGGDPRFSELLVNVNGQDEDSGLDENATFRAGLDVSFPLVYSLWAEMATEALKSDLRVEIGYEIPKTGEKLILSICILHSWK